MASIFRLLSVTILFVSLFNAVSAVQDDELQTMLTVLRARGYTLFSNAIATSDLDYDVVSGESFTFFAPTDSSLFTLDMSDTASDYTNTLRCHVIPRRLSISELRRFPSGSLFKTLLKGREVKVQRRRRSLGADVITIDGVDVVLPGLFYGSDIAVHGLGGILNLTNGDELLSTPPPVVPRRRRSPHSPVNFTNSRGKIHSPPANLSANHSIGSPMSSQSQLPLPPENFSDRPRPINSSSNHSIGSPIASQIHAPPPPENFSDLFPPRNSSADHSIASPPINQAHAPPPLANISDHLEPPSYIDIDNCTIESLVPEPAFAESFSPSYPPELDHSPPRISPAPDHSPPRISPTHDLWYKIPISPAFTPINAPPSPEYPHNPMSFPPSIGGFHDGEEQNVSIIGADYDKKLKSEVYGGFSAISPEDLAGIMEMVQEYLDPIDQRIFDCWLTDELRVHVSLPHGYLYTRQQTPTPTASFSCAGL